MGNVALDCGIGQCREEVTLFVGCDVGGSQHAVAIIDGAGTVLEKLDRVYNHRKGFEFLLGKIKHWAKRTGAKRIQFAFEPTGHSWKPLVHFISEQGIEVFFIKTTAVPARSACGSSSRQHRSPRISSPPVMFVEAVPGGS